VVGAAAPMEGRGPPVAFVEAMTRSELSPPRALHPDAPLRLLSKYNASEGHSGAGRAAGRRCAVGAPRGRLGRAGVY